jgi:hypothetical protein
MKFLSSKANGMKIEDVIQTKQTMIQKIEAVDDTSIFTNDDREDLKRLKEKLKNDGAWWSRLLESCGGKLELTNCFYFIDVDIG